MNFKKILFISHFMITAHASEQIGKKTAINYLIDRPIKQLIVREKELSLYNKIQICRNIKKRYQYYEVIKAVLQSKTLDQYEPQRKKELQTELFRLLFLGIPLPKL
jgi:hypothetical protein